MKVKTTLLLPLLFCTAAIITSFSCDHKERAWGTTNWIITVADSTDWLEIEGTVRATFEKEIYTPQLESLLEINKIAPSELDVFDRYHNLLIIGTLESGSGISELFESRLSPESYALVESDSLYLFKSVDPFYQPQLLVMIVAKDLGTLKRRLEENKVFLFNLMDEHVRTVIAEQLYYNYEKKDVEKDLLEKYGWMVRVPHEFSVVEENEAEAYIWMRRVNPERWLLVHWEETNDPALLTEEYCLKTRSWIGESVYDNELLKDGFAQFERVDFNGRYTLLMRGLWETDTQGGPFALYSFYDEDSGRIYSIDIACYAAGKEKMPYMRQLEVIARTFATENEMEEIKNK